MSALGPIVNSSTAFLQTSLASLQDAEVATGTRESLRLLDLPEAWVLVLVILPLAALVSWVGYFREGISLPVRATLATLRFLALALLLFVLFRPVFVQRNEEVKKAEVLVLVDDSASMGRRDAYSGDEPVRRELATLSSKALGETSRLELAVQGVQRELLPVLSKGDYQVRTMRFAQDIAPAPDLSGLAARGRATHIGDALAWALAANRGRHVTDVVIVSDGRSNGGGSPLDAARTAGSAGIPVHTVVVGDTRPERNLLIELIEVPTEVLEGDEIAITARVVGRGTKGEVSTRVTLEEVSERDPRGRLLDEQIVRPDESGQRVVFVAPPAPPEVGMTERRFRISVAPIDEETLLDDNEIQVSVHTRPEKIRVLYIDGYPRWEYRFLKELLKRSDKNIEAQMFLLSATPDFLQESTLGMAPLSAVPTDRKELLENYDVIILGDVRLDDVSRDQAKVEEFTRSLREFVERGGGLLFQAGELDDPRTYVDTELEELLPVVLDATGGLTYQGDLTDEWRPELDQPTAPHQIVRLHPDTDVNRRLWEEEEGLRGFYWYHPVQRAKPGSHVLLRHPYDEGPYGKNPLLVVGYFPAGRTMFLGVDSTWMWRFRFGDRYHERFWRNSIRWLALGRLKSGNRRVRLDTLRSRYDLDERITLEARVLDEDFRPSERLEQEIVIEGPDGDEEERVLERVPGRDGIYRASFEVARPGLYRARVEERGQRVAASEFEVVLPSRENQDPSPDPAGLASLSSLSGGRAVSLAALSELDEEFPGGEERREAISSRLEDAWDRWATLLVALGLLSAEWILRKRFELV